MFVWDEHTTFRWHENCSRSWVSNFMCILVGSFLNNLISIVDIKKLYDHPIKSCRPKESWKSSAQHCQSTGSYPFSTARDTCFEISNNFPEYRKPSSSQAFSSAFLRAFMLSKFLLIIISLTCRMHGVLLKNFLLRFQTPCQRSTLLIEKPLTLMI